MPRKKKTPFAPWESRKADGIEERYFRMGASFMASEAVRGLSGNAFKTLCFMKIASAGKKQFKFPFSKYKSFMAKSTFFRARDELVKAGFIQIDQCNKNLRQANVYSFSEDWKDV